MIKNIQKKNTKVKNNLLINTSQNIGQKLVKEKKSSSNENKLFHRSLEAFSDCV